jgi:SAM-dependent methyltransferase
MTSTSSVRFYLPPKGSLTPNGVSDPLSYYYRPLVGKLYINRLNLVLNLLEGRRFANALEIGYGSGILMPTLCKVSEQVYGVDLNSDPDRVAEQLNRFNCYPKLSRGRAGKLLFEDETFDLIVAISVLEHIAEIQEFLTEIYRTLKPGGWLLVGMPAVNKTMEYLFQAIGFSGINDHHVTSPEDMVKAAKSLFRLGAVSWMPGFLPSNVYLYKAFRLEK